MAPSHGPPSASTTCSATATVKRHPQFRAGGCRFSRASSQPNTSRSAPGSSAPACGGPWPAPTPSSPCAAASSAAASRISGSDQPQTPPEGHLTNLTCIPFADPCLTTRIRCRTLHVKLHVRHAFAAWLASDANSQTPCFHQLNGRPIRQTRRLGSAEQAVHGVACPRSAARLFGEALRQSVRLASRDRSLERCQSVTTVPPTPRGRNSRSHLL